MPASHIDHINGARSDNRIENLRLCTPSQNMHNSLHMKSEDRGFRVCRKTGKFRPSVVINGKRHYLGGFATKQEARAAYVEFKRKFAGEFSPV